MNSETLPTHLIPEWADQSAVFLAWPYADGDFSPWLADVEGAYLRIATEIARREHLLVACRNGSHRDDINRRLMGQGIDQGRVSFVIMPYDDVWVRDTSPLTVTSDDGVSLLDFRFNGWGGKYEHADDARIAQNLHASGKLGMTVMDGVDFVLEGGSIETDGAGTLMTTARCLLNPNRNPDYSRTQIETLLSARLGAEKILWLEHGYAEGDDTDAHIDTLARFCSKETIAFTACDDPGDSLYPEFQAMAAQLATFTNTAAQPYRLVPLPMPSPIWSEDGERLPATYANFLIINGAVLVPVYNDPADNLAMDRLATCFPDREIIAIDCVPLIRQYGSLHCMTMQFPSLVMVS